MAVKESGIVPFRWWIISDSGLGIFWPQGLPDHSSPVWEAKYDNDTEHKKRTTRDKDGIGCLGGLLVQMNRLSGEWSERIGYAVEPDPLTHGGGLHVLDSGGWLSTHLDYAAHPHLPGKERRLNLIAFLNPQWKKEWGGALQLCNPMGDPIKEIYPEPGKLVAFETGDESYHGVSKVVGPVPRITAAVYFLSDLRPGVTRQRALFIPNRGSM